MRHLLDGGRPALSRQRLSRASRSREPPNEAAANIPGYGDLAARESNPMPGAASATALPQRELRPGRPDLAPRGPVAGDDGTPQDRGRRGSTGSQP